MNYYIQGDAAKADQIKAAFEKLGMSDLSGYNFGNGHALFYTYDCGGSKVIAISCVSLHAADIIKTHPDYKELELPVEPKFKVGDWIVRGKGFVYEPSLITEIRDYYICELLNGERVTYTLNDVHKNFHLWTIADAKDGDVLVTEDYIFIFKYILHGGVHLYCHYDIDGIDGEEFDADTPDVIIGNIHDKGAHFQPATQKQRDLFFTKMEEAGYEWDAEKRELKKIKPHYDISNFKPFDKVLVRQNDSCTWGVSFFGRYSGMFMCCTNVWFEQCIPYEGNEHLLGTTDMCDECYVNW